MPNTKGPNNKDLVYEKLDDQLKYVSVASKEIDPNKMNITTYHSSKGLECKVCILLNVDNLIDKKLLYVGITRASERLCIHSFLPGWGRTFKELFACYEEIIASRKNDILTSRDFDSSLEKGKSFDLEKIRREHPNAYKLWEENEELELINLYNSGKNIKQIAVLLGRQKGGILARLKKLGIISCNIKPS